MLTFFALTFALAFLGILAGVGAVALQQRHHRLQPVPARRPRVPRRG